MRESGPRADHPDSDLARRSHHLRAARSAGARGRARGCHRRPRGGGRRALGGETEPSRFLGNVSRSCTSEFESYIRFLGSYFFVRGLEREDIEQEAWIAVWLAPPGLERMAARRQVLDLIKMANRRPEFHRFMEDPASHVDVETVVAARERLREVIDAATTPMEKIAVGRAARGEPISRHESGLGVALWRLRQRLMDAA